MCNWAGCGGRICHHDMSVMTDFDSIRKFCMENTQTGISRIVGGTAERGVDHLNRIHCLTDLQNLKLIGGVEEIAES